MGLQGLPWDQAPDPQGGVDLAKLNAARIGMGLAPIAPAPPPAIAAPDQDLAPAPRMNPQAIQAGMAGNVPAPAMPHPAAVSTEDAIARSLGSAAAPLPRGVRPAVRSPAEEATAAGKIDPRTLVGHNMQSNQIPTVVTGPTGGGGGKPQLQLAGMSTQETVHNPAALAIHQAGVQGEANATVEKTAAEKQQAEELAQIGRVGNAGIDRREREMQAREQARQTQIQSETSKLGQLTDQVRTGQIDPNRYWRDKSTGDKLAGALAVALGAMAGGKTGVNHALDIYDRAVQRDIDAQKVNLEQGNRNLENQKGLVATMRQNFGDAAQSDAAAKMAYVEGFARDVQQSMRENASPLIQAQGNALLAGLEQRRGLALDEFTKQTETKSYHMVAPGGGGSVVAPHADIKKNEVVKGPDGQEYEFGEGSTAQDAAKQLAATNEALGLTRTIKDASARIAKNPLDMDARSTLASAAAQLKFINGKAEGGQPRMSKEYSDTVDAAIGGNQAAMTNLGKGAGLATFESGLQAHAKGIIDQNAISTVESFQERNAKGEEILRYRRKARAPKPSSGPVGTEVGEAP